MKRLLFVLYSFLSFLFSLVLATNLFAYLLHFANILGKPHFGRWYEPFHLVYWYFTIRVPGNQYRISFIAFFACFCILAFLGFRIYTKLNLNVLGIYGQSRWLKTRELRAMGAFIGSGTILGQSKHARFRMNHKHQYKMTSLGKIIFDDDKTHILVVAPTRSGKGISCVIPTLLSWTHSAVVYDIKKENFEITSGWRRKFSYVFRFEPTNPDSIHFNPLWEIDKGPHEVSQAQNIAEIISNPNGDDQVGDHWRITARQLLVGAILYVLYSDDEKDKSLYGVFRLLNTPNKRTQDVLEQMLDLKHSAVQEAARNMLNKAPNELSSVVSTASSFLAIYQDPIVAANTAYSDFRIKDLTNSDHPCTLYICVNPESAERLRPLTRLLLDFICKKLTSDLYVNKNRMLFLIDEFPSLGRLNFFETQLAYFAGYNIKCMLIAQSFNQLFAKYGERNAIIDNCKHKAILGVGSPQDAKLVADFLGSYSINRKTVSQTGTLGNIIARSRSTSYMETERKLMTVDEILRLPYQDFLLINDGELPYRGRKIMYYADKRFHHRVKLPTFSRFFEQEREIPSRRLQLDWTTNNDLEELKRKWAQIHQEPLAEIAAKTPTKKIEALPSEAGSLPDQARTLVITPSPDPASEQHQTEDATNAPTTPGTIFITEKDFH